MLRDDTDHPFPAYDDPHESEPARCEPDAPAGCNADELSAYFQARAKLVRADESGLLRASIMRGEDPDCARREMARMYSDEFEKCAVDVERFQCLVENAIASGDADAAAQYRRFAEISQERMAFLSWKMRRLRRLQLSLMRQRNGPRISRCRVVRRVNQRSVRRTGRRAVARAASRGGDSGDSDGEPPSRTTCPSVGGAS